MCDTDTRATKSRSVWAEGPELRGDLQSWTEHGAQNAVLDRAIAICRFDDSGDRTT